MNKHIELVKKWLADNDSVTLQELEDSFTASASVTAVADSVTAAAIAATEGDARDVAFWVKRYEELTK